MGTLDPWGNHIAKMRILVNPSLGKPFLVEIKPSGLDISNLFNVLLEVASFNLLYALIEGLLI